jgi:hypothetical protein
MKTSGEWSGCSSTWQRLWTRWLKRQWQEWGWGRQGSWVSVKPQWSGLGQTIICLALRVSWDAGLNALNLPRLWWLTPGILVAQEAEIRRIRV